jgi:hypothetical protein
MKYVLYYALGMGLLWVFILRPLFSANDEPSKERE